MGSAVNVRNAFLSSFMTSLFICWFWPMGAWCQDEAADKPATFTFYWENDAVTGTDRDYSNGVKFTWNSAYSRNQDEPSSLTSWIMDRMPGDSGTDTKRATSLSLGHIVFTPEETDRSDLVEDDRPYAGYAYMGFGFHSQTGKRSQTFELDVGVVGPASQAQALQDAIHDWVDVRRSEGWDNQLENELGLEAIYETKWRVWKAYTPSSFSADLITHLGGRLGNIAIKGNAGGEFRFGWFVPENFGTCPIRPGCDADLEWDTDIGRSKNSEFGLHFFISVDGRLVLRDIFLDGNTFQDSHSVEKEVLVADLMAGMAINYGRWSFSYAQVYRSKEFKEQNSNHAFGAVSITYSF